MTTAVPVAPMTSRERVLAALRREPVDRTPVVNPTSVATVELMDLAEAPFPAANREPELMARLAATGHTELGFDTIMPVFSIIQESSALGCRIQWEQKDNWPTVRMSERMCDSSSAASSRGVPPTRKSDGVISLTFLSVVCAESSTATSRVNESW